MDASAYIGFTNGALNVDPCTFFPTGTAPNGDPVSMSTNYAYVAPDDPHFRKMRAEINEFLRTLHADD